MIVPGNLDDRDKGLLIAVGRIGVADSPGDGVDQEV
jgi:hypothetical protein